MRRISGALILFTLLGVSSASAVERSVLTSQKVNSSSSRITVGLGLDVRMERTEEQTQKSQNFSQVLVGLERERFGGWIEYGRSPLLTSGNETLKVQRQSENILMAVSVRANDLKVVSPYLAIGVGGLREKVETMLYQDVSAEESGWTFLGMGAFGLRFWPDSGYLISTELRVLESTQLDPNPTFAGALHLGLVF